eukprot:g1653.t1
MSTAPRTPAAAYGMISMSQAQQIVLDHSFQLPVLSLPTKDAAGFIVSEEVIAEDPLPPFPASIKDGYAVHSSDGPGEYPISTSCFAGKTEEFQLEPKTAAYITTGAPVPPGADAVVMIENTEFIKGTGEQDTVKIKTSVNPGTDIRPVGSDIEVGVKILSKGDLIGVAEVGLLATIAKASVKVVQKPKVAILSNGDELLEFDSETKAQFGEIRDANRPMLLACCKERGFIVIDLGIARDIEGDIQSRIENAIEQKADVIICSGGVAMGSRDDVKPVLESIGIVHFGKVKMKPGKPLTFATIQKDSRTVLFFGLPGNPVSSYACFHLVVLPALNKLQGWKDPMLRRIEVKLVNSIKLDPQRPEYARAIVQWKE